MISEGKRGLRNGFHSVLRCEEERVLLERVAMDSMMENMEG